MADDQKEINELIRKKDELKSKLDNTRLECPHCKKQNVLKRSIKQHMLSQKCMKARGLFDKVEKIIDIPFKEMKLE